MKIMRLLLPGLLLISICKAQVKKDEFPALISAKQLSFKATSVSPYADAELNSALRTIGKRGGNALQLSSLAYDLQISPDSITAFLPYLGRSNGGVADREDLGIKFTSKKFDYEVRARKKGGWQIQVNIKDSQYGYRLNLEVFKTGYASLHVRDNFRQPVNYDGYIEPLIKK